MPVYLECIFKLKFETASSTVGCIIFKVFAFLLDPPGNGINTGRSKIGASMLSFILCLKQNLCWQTERGEKHRKDSEEVTERKVKTRKENLGMNVSITVMDKKRWMRGVWMDESKSGRISA